MNFRIDLYKDRGRLDTLETRVKRRMREYDIIAVRRVGENTTKAGRFKEAMAEIEDAKRTILDIREELTWWLENLHPSQEESDKRREIWQAIDAIDTVTMRLDAALAEKVDFPKLI